MPPPNHRKSASTPSKTTKSKNRQQSKKKPPSSTPALTLSQPPQDPAPLNILLSLFQSSFSDLFASPSLTDLIQAVKGHLYSRDYAAAFGTPDHLSAYAVRWSPSRALAYRNVFLDICPEVREVFDVGSGEVDADVVCIGGGAGAEVVGAAGAVKALESSRSGESEEGKGKRTLRLTAIDIADWSGVLGSLVTRINETYLGSDEFSTHFHQADILAPASPALIPPSTKLVTFLFTTNELYTQSRAQTTRLLLELGGKVGKGCLVLVLESAGSYSTVKVGERVFSMDMLLEHTLLKTAQDGNGRPQWEILLSEDSRWYRLPEGVRYPLKLEDMRYLVRVFRRI